MKGSESHIQTQAELEDAGVDPGSRDTGVDPGPRDASTQTWTPCYSPVQTPDAGRGISSQGCECDPKASGSYCIDHLAISCREPENEWSFGVDGACFPRKTIAPVGHCQALGGALVARGTTCPSGFDTDYGYASYTTDDAGVGEYDDCCYPISVPAQNCTNAGLTVLAAGTESSLLATKCSNGGALRAFVVGQPAASLCCAAP